MSRGNPHPGPRYSPPLPLACPDSSQEVAGGAVHGYRQGALLKAVPPLLALLLLTCATPRGPAPFPATEPLRSESARPATADLAPAGERLAGALEAPPPGELPVPDYLKRLDFRGGEPQVPIGLMQGRREVRFSPRGRMRLRFGGDAERMLEAPAGSVWTVRVTSGTPAELSARIQLEELPFADKEGLAEVQARWQARGVAVRAHVLGVLYGITGKVIDNRRYLLLLDEELTPRQATERQAELLHQFGVRTTLFEEVRVPSRAILEVRDEAGNVVGLAQDTVYAETLDGAGFDVRQVEHDVGYDNHGFEDRSFRGTLQLAVDLHGTLAVVNVVKLEELLKGLVPSEIYARAHPEALKAQAVTARGEVLAKVGIKHLADPYLLCSEQHCAVYRGRTGEAASTSAAVEATRGEGLFSSDGKLVDSVYSAMCGGHTEDNEVVWGGPPNPSLRGRPDLIGPAEGLPTPESLAEYLRTELPAACHLSTFARAGKYRWEKRFTVEQVNALTAHLGVGPAHALSLGERGVSGRARTLTVAGERGVTQVRGELNIRRLFGMLNSSMALLEEERDAEGHLTGWRFRGGGWGHGVGMCQTGAIGRAEAGQRYRDILRFYFNGAEVAPIY
ncbi:SpoIID/LytB domain-containing protein [Archangium sp.]|uniref:SpoIID/LytB domain-containing protein n=1 Tax=Archangium sp. TaxID=1872627 RepID=UPI002D3C7299|nr:SpoIID/LytB domain-containing protein [Archangium sp.]HYO55515.1 SpoIID/LytB domain-containing protein [Archangium sp.]